ncbi:hypothetical protein DIPPA_27982 [Diplonema papillatum]|nr:hypothetical protein DIPPA_27982 [Diplonema papillatum]
MEEIEQYLQKAQRLAEEAEDEAQISAVFGIIKVLLILTEKAGQKRARERGMATPQTKSKPKTTTNPKAGQKQPEKAEQEQPAKQTTAAPMKHTTAAPAEQLKQADRQADTATKEGTARKEPRASGWKEVVGRKKPAAPKNAGLRTDDWGMKAIDVKSVLEGNTRRGIVETTTEEGRKVVAHAKELTDLEADGVALVVITPKPADEERSTYEIVFSTDGTPSYRYVTLCGDARAAQGRIGLKKTANETQVLVFTALHRELPKETVTLLTDKKKGAGVIDRMCATAARDNGAEIEKRHRWRHADLPERSTCMVRVTLAQANKLLACSGNGGHFWSAPSFARGGETDSVLWLDKAATLDDALALAALPGTNGLAAAVTRLGVRYTGDEALEELQEAAGDLVAPPRYGGGLAYFVTGGRNEHAADITAALRDVGWNGAQRKSFTKEGRTRLIVVSQQPPPATVVSRMGRDPIFVRPIARGDEPRGGAKANVWEGRIPRASLPKQPVKSDAPMDPKEGHIHVWQEPERNKGTQECEECEAPRQNGTMMRTCFCAARICGTCYTAASKKVQEVR